ncbi:hypothetical protein [Sphingobium bisphenolivorans]|uniref:hypothetical protein n=1 Tax=Sphingobium bisphenolivorans TaxID=1335760 RepID=UPI00126A66FC|nr:hypothetical protein [Sphingobium bisphenolivorans]
MTPVNIFRPVRLQNIVAPAVVLPVDRYDQPFLILGEGEGAIACFIGNEHRFETMPAFNNENWKGLAFEDLEVEVDLQSLIGVEGHAAPTGSLVRKDKRLELIAIARERVFADRRRFVICDDLPAGDGGIEVAFTRWYLVKREGERVIFKHEIVAGDPPE